MIKQLELIDDIYDALFDYVSADKADQLCDLAGDVSEKRMKEILLILNEVYRETKCLTR